MVNKWEVFYLRKTQSDKTCSYLCCICNHHKQIPLCYYNQRVLKRQEHRKPHNVCKININVSDTPDAVSVPPYVKDMNKIVLLACVTCNNFYPY